MNVSITDFDVKMDVKNNGIELEVRRPNGTRLGDLVITKTRLIWCDGQTSRANGKEIEWPAFIRLMNAR